MSQNVFYRTDRLTEWIDTADRLRSEVDWEPVYWVGPPQLRSEVKAAYSDVAYHIGREALRGIPSPDVGGLDDVTLDGSILERYEPYSHLVMRLMDRVDPGHSFSYDERLRHFHNLLRYWLGVLDRFEVDVAVFNEPPHNVSDYVFYAICQEASVPTPMLVRTILPGQWFVRGNVHEENPELEKQARAAEGTEREDISEESLEYLEEVKSDSPEVWLEWSKSRYEYLEKLKNLAKYPAYLGKLFQTASNSYKVKNRTIEESQVTWARFVLHKWKTRLDKRALRRCYERLSVDPDISRKYVFVPLHYQPEKSTVPEGGIYENQYLVVHLLSKVVPDDWAVYVKEHPTQFEPAVYGERGRSTYDYHDIDALENVFLIDHERGSLNLVDGAVAVATVTGTAAWEGVIRGTPGIVFGNATFRTCGGVHHVNDREELEATIRSIEVQPETSFDDVLSYVYAVEQVGFRRYDYIYESVINVPREETVANTADALADFVADNDAEYGWT